MDVAARREAYKRTVDPSSAFESRKKTTAALRQKAKEEAAKERRLATTAPLPDVTNALFGSPSNMQQQFVEWKRVLQVTEPPPEQVECIRSACLELVSSPLQLTPSAEQAFMQVLLLVAQSSPGPHLLPFFPLMLNAIRGGSAECVRGAALFMTTALENDNTDDAVNTFMWDFDQDPVGVIMAALPSQRREVQGVLMLCIKTACAVRNLERLVKLAPFLLSLVRCDTYVATLAIECVSELSTNATLDELQLLRECGLLAYCIHVIGHAQKEHEACIAQALHVIDAFAEFCTQTDAPSIWLITDGALSALCNLVLADWYEDTHADMLSRIVANVTVTCLEPVLAQSRLCAVIIGYLFDETLDSQVHEEALNFILNVVKLPGLDAARVQTIADIDGFDALLHALDVMAKGNDVLTSEILVCLRDCLVCSPVHTNDIAELGGVQTLVQLGLTSEGCVQSLVMSLLKDHFPAVFYS